MTRSKEGKTIHVLMHVCMKIITYLITFLLRRSSNPSLYSSEFRSQRASGEMEWACSMLNNPRVTLAISLSLYALTINCDAIAESITAKLTPFPFKLRSVSFVLVQQLNVGCLEKKYKHIAYAGGRSE